MKFQKIILFQPETKHYGHPFEHFDQAVVEAEVISLEEQQYGVSMIDGVGQGGHHLLNQNLVFAICISETRGVHNLDNQN